ncbi:MAG TPA: VIT domain-containing protein [Kofleriaceae bacterium]|nr:VIT domain-containing protein [Kofleriaceae bacterium]
MRAIPLALALVSLVGSARCDRGRAADAVRAAPGGPTAPALVATAAPAAEVAPPFTLTATDGSGLELTRVDARVVVEGPLAYTELHLDFHNGEDRRREGTFAITLPAGAAVSRFAMETDGAWQEAAVVARPLARRAYDDFLHRRQDPALLEKAAGNQFSARVFPIAPRADKHLIVSFSQELAGRPYTLPLRGLPATARVDVALEAAQADGSRARGGLHERAWRPDRDFVASVAAGPAAVGAGDTVVAVVPFAPAGGAAAADLPRKLVLAVDTSASRALGFASYVRSVRALVAALRARAGDPLELQVVAFDQDVQPIFDGLAADYGDAQDRALLARGAAGASDLEALVAVLARSPRAADRRLAIVTDGVMTAGADTATVVAAAAKLPVSRIDVVLAGGLRDDDLAAALVRARPRAGDVLDLDDGAEAVAEGLGQPVATDVAVTVPGATWVYPSTLASVRPGRAVVVRARLPAAASSIDVALGGTRRTLAVAAAPAPLVARAIAGAQLAELEQRLATTTDAGAAAALRTELTTRSVQARVLSSQTSMLVLETDDDYARYGIDRSHAPDLLVIGAHGVEAARPAALAAAATKHVAAPEPIAAAPDGADDTAGTGTAMALDEGAMGRRDAAVDDARLAGLLGAEPAAEDPAEAPTDGGYGFGRSGFGPGGGGTSGGTGGGGTGWGTIGTGRYGTIGHGAGTGSGYGVGSGRGAMRGRTASVPSVRIGAAPVVAGDLDRDLLRRNVRRYLPRMRACYERELASDAALGGALTIRFAILPDGHVSGALASGVSHAVDACVTGVVETMRFPAVPGGGAVNVSYPVSFRPMTGAAGDRGEAVDSAIAASSDDDTAATAADDDGDDVDRGPPALTGPLADITARLATDPAGALAAARAWHEQAPGDVLALVALGEAQEAGHDSTGAARTYGSIIDLFPARADLRRFAGERLERVADAAPATRALAVDTYRKAVADRPDHVSGHRLLAYALLRAGDPAAAFTAILAGVDQPGIEGRYAGADRVLGEDAGLIGAAWLAAGGPRATIAAELERRHLALATTPSTRFVLTWETDANDVDLHVWDHRGGHAFYSAKELPSGGALYADITTGYGPECFTIPGTPAAGPYRLAADYYARGPMGYGMGLLQLERFDGHALTFEDRPFVIMNDHAMVDLGTY